MNASHFQERWEIYGFIASYKHLYPIERMCKVFKVSRSSFYRWYRAGPSKRALEHSLFTDLIKNEFDLSKQRYGSTKIAEQLKRKGHCISRSRVAKTSIFEYIEIWYNRKRLHSFLGYKTPYEVEQEFYQFKNVA
ncbi:IS3 family transposase [Thalassobellus suaedae]|uniref:IS3 family transposase n=1 Tax=Thalassobellus suaedae TaxID=3074124 RepID=A0ABY9Y2U4_9FLAO|nr:IS3 family transposase [Flavobacteriaceae bacterium HL-DH10]